MEPAVLDLIVQGCVVFFAEGRNGTGSDAVSGAFRGGVAIFIEKNDSRVGIGDL